MTEFYNIKHMLTYNRIINMCIGNRTAGKSFSAKWYALSDFFNSKNQFVYLRRYENELNLKTLFDDIKQLKYPNIEIKLEGRDFYKEIYINDELAGFGVALSKYDKLKTVSFVDVNKIIFDEFLSENTTRYLKNEVEAFLNLYQTIDRGGGKVSRCVKAFLISNAISIVNPYFSYFDLIPKMGITKTKSIVIDMFVNESVNNEIADSQFEHLIKGTRYGKFSMETKYYLDDLNFVVDRNLKDFHNRYIFKYDDFYFGIWINNHSGYFYASKKFNKNTLHKYCVRSEDFSDDVMLLQKSNKKIILKYFQQAFELGCFEFDSLQTKYATLHVLNYLNN